MKRILLLILLVMAVVWVARSRRVSQEHGVDFAARSLKSRSIDRSHRDAEQAARKARQTSRRAVAEAQAEVARSLREVRQEVRESLQEADDEVRESLQEAANEVRVAVDGIPVPIIPGSRVEDAVPQPPEVPILPADPLAEALPQSPTPAAAFPGLVKIYDASKPLAPAPHGQSLLNDEGSQSQVISGLISATEGRAREEARKTLDRHIADWLEAQDVPRSWVPTTRQVDQMILDTKVERVVKDYGTLYVAKLRVDASPERRAGFVRAYQQQLVHKRMLLLGGGLAFFLACLGALSGYIRADEATKGYYTNRLRLLAAAGVGAAGVAIYQVVV